METDECLNNNGGCWRDEKTNVTACKVVLVPTWPPPPKFLGVHNTSTLPACLPTNRLRTGMEAGHLQREDLPVPCGGWRSVPRRRVHRLQRYHRFHGYWSHSFHSTTEHFRPVLRCIISRRAGAVRHGQWRVLEGDETRENFLCLLGNSAQNSVSCVTSFGVIFRHAVY